MNALASEGIATRIDNPYQEMGANYNPQKGALKYAESLDLVAESEWILISDVDEFVNIHSGAGDLTALFDALPDAEVISMQWRLFGSSGHTRFKDALVTERHQECAPEYCPSPIQAWGIKSLFRTKGPGVAGAFNKLGVHRPLKKVVDRPVRWVNGSGDLVHEDYYKGGWRFGVRDYGYDLVTLNHYAVRSAESFLVKRDRGRVNHINRDQGLAYWLRMNFNMERDASIQRRLPATRKVLKTLHKLPSVTERHDASVAAHKKKIAELLGRKDMNNFYSQISSPDLDLISRHLNFLTRPQFEKGPQSIPQKLLNSLRNLPAL